MLWCRFYTALYLNNCFDKKVIGYKTQLNIISQRLIDLNPDSILDRGYAILYNDKGKVINEKSGLNRGDSVNIKMSQLDIKAKINKIKVRLND